MDFTGFKFNEKHSSDFGIYRVSDGSRYQESLIPTFSDYTSEVAGGTGTHYWGSDFKTKTFNLSFAFDSVTEIQLRKMRKWLATPKLSQLIFDEVPYKYYMGKVTSEPQIEYICFDEYDKEKGYNRVYKGEGTISFVCFYPFARSVYKYLDEYDENIYSNKSEWAESTGMLASKDDLDVLKSGSVIAHIYNPGDLETDWKFTFNKDIIGDFELNVSANDGTNSFTDNFVIGTTLNGVAAELGELGTLVKESIGKIEVDTKKRMVTFIYNDNGKEKRLPALFLLRSGDLFTFKHSSEKQDIQFNFTNIENKEDIELKYDYLYY